MITKISIKKVASYGDDPAVLETDKRVNLIYGLNGSGKTTFSNFLADRNHKDFSDCSIDGLVNEKILVYNQEFIKKNFYDKNQLNGIFTLSSINKEAEEKIKNAENEIEKIELQIKDDHNKKGLQYDLEKKINELRDLRTNAEEKIWEIKTEYTGGDRVLELCLTGLMGSKDALFQYISKISKDTDKPKETIQELKKEVETTQGIDAKKYNENEINKITFDFSKIEVDPIFLEVIIGNENSTISNFIKELNNADWVKQGVSYLIEPVEKNVKCPFCQKETITSDVYSNIKNYFDITYQNKVNDLIKLEKEYWEAFQLIPKINDFLEKPLIKSKESEFTLLYEKLTVKLRSNWNSIKKKKDFPSNVLILESTEDEINNFNNFLDRILLEVKTHNLKIDNKEKTKASIKNIFWQIMRWEYDQTIENYNTRKSFIDTEINNLKKDINLLEEKKKSEISKKVNAEKETVNIDEAIKNINNGLKDLGSDGFQIKKNDDRFYQIRRSGKTENQFETLSEGEKTIISFLYFLELCKGKEKEDEIIVNKIIIIDDPISSLSHIYIFNISQLIKFYFFEKAEFKQVFVLTHSLYFFHELMHTSYEIKKENKLFRILKLNNQKSTIIELRKDEIKNDYQSYWQVIKDHDEGKSSDALLANSMRNILEHFFGFIEKETFNDSIKKIDPYKYGAFIRYVNRESHSDFTNISDRKEIDPSIFKQAFKEVFEKSGYEKHYARMISNI